MAEPSAPFKALSRRPPAQVLAFVLILTGQQQPPFNRRLRRRLHDHPNLLQSPIKHLGVGERDYPRPRPSPQNNRIERRRRRKEMLLAYFPSADQRQLLGWGEEGGREERETGEAKNRKPPPSPLPSASLSPTASQPASPHAPHSVSPVGPPASYREIRALNALCPRSHPLAGLLESTRPAGRPPSPSAPRGFGR